MVEALLAGLAFYFILEGLLPFLSPASFKELLMQLQDLSYEQLRKYGAVMLILGSGILFYLK